MENLKIIILGSGSIVPTPERNHSSLWLRHGGDILLWDCGEGTQQQLQKAELSYMNIDKIFITHWHADHFAGLIGLLETFNLEGRKEKLQIFGPQAQHYMSILSQLHQGEPQFEIEIINVNYKNLVEQTILEEKDYIIKSVPAFHTIPAAAYCLQEKDRWNIDMEKASQFDLKPGPILNEIKQQGEITYKGQKIKLKEIAHLTPGRKIVYSGDTAPSPFIEKMAENADILIHDATFLKESSHHHSTVKDAALLASRAGVKKLVLTHYSRRYEDLDLLLKKASQYHDNVILARDLKQIL